MAAVEAARKTVYMPLEVDGVRRPFETVHYFSNDSLKGQSKKMLMWLERLIETKFHAEGDGSFGALFLIARILLLCPYKIEA